MAKVDWNAGEYEARSGFEVLPKGRYLAVVDYSELKPTKRKDGKFFEFEFVVLKPDQFKNRRLWARFNVHNPSEQAQRIGREQFNALCEACGLTKEAVDDTAKLNDKIVTLIVDIDKTGPSGDVNRVTGFLKSEAAANPAAQKLAKDAREQSAAERSKPAASGGAKRTPPPPMDDDDIPF